MTALTDQDDPMKKKASIPYSLVPWKSSRKFLLSTLAKTNITGSAEYFTKLSFSQARQCFQLHETAKRIASYE